MKALNGDAPWPSPMTVAMGPEEAEAYQAVAAGTDAGVTHIMGVALKVAGATPGAVVAGAVMALVRFSLETMEVPRTVRNLIALLVPSINRAAEQIVATRAAPEA